MLKRECLQPDGEAELRRVPQDLQNDLPGGKKPPFFFALVFVATLVKCCETFFVFLNWLEMLASHFFNGERNTRVLELLDRATITVTYPGSSDSLI